MTAFRIPLDARGRVAEIILPTPLTRRDAEQIVKWIEQLLLPVLPES